MEAVAAVENTLGCLRLLEAVPGVFMTEGEPVIPPPPPTEDVEAKPRGEGDGADA